MNRAERLNTGLKQNGSLRPSSAAVVMVKKDRLSITWDMVGGRKLWGRTRLGCLSADCVLFERSGE
jgi:hypothetical protein